MTNISDFVVKIPDDPSISELQQILITLANRYPTAMYNYKTAVKIYKKKEDFLEIKKAKEFRDVEAQTYGKKNLTVTEKKLLVLEQLEKDFEELNAVRGVMLTWEAIVESIEEQINICKKILSFSESEYRKSSNM